MLPVFKCKEFGFVWAYPTCVQIFVSLVFLDQFGMLVKNANTSACNFNSVWKAQPGTFGLFPVSCWPTYGVYSSGFFMNLSTANLYEWVASCGAVILIRLYNGKRGRGNKWFFYAAYPVHLGVIALLNMLVV